MPAIEIPLNFGEGGKGLNPSRSVDSRNPDLVSILHNFVDDIGTVKTFCNSLRTAYQATLAKLDADAGVTDTNYAATNPGPAAIGTLLNTKGTKNT